MLKRKAFPVLIAFLLIAGCSYFNPEDLNLLIDQSRGGLTLSGVSISPTAITTNGGAHEITLSCSVESDFPVNTVSADLSSVGQGKVKLNPSSDKKNWSIKFIVTPSALGSFSFKVTAVNQKEKTAESAVSLTVMALSLSAIYVSAAGNDANPGSQDFPFKTLAHAVTYATTLGITNIYMAGGTYIEANTAYSCAVALVGLTNLTIQGGWNSGFTARSVETYPTVIDGNHVQPTVMVIKNTTNVTVDGIVIKNGKPDSALTSFITFRGGGLYAEQANFNFINGWIDGNESVNGGGVYGEQITGIISNCIISNNTSVNLDSGMVLFRSSIRIEHCSINGNNGDGLRVLNCTNFIFQYNLINTNYGDGLVISNSVSSSPISYNEFTRSFRYGLLLFKSSISAISNNLFLSNNTALYIVSNTSTPVISNLIISNLGGVDTMYSGFYFGNNIVIGGSTGMSINQSVGMNISNNIIGRINASYTAPVYINMCSNLLFMNNTVFNGAVYGYYVDNYKASGGVMVIDSTNINIINNMIVSNSYSAQNGYGGGGVGLYNSMVLISNNIISWNSGRIGGGISSYSSDIVVDGNTINQNICYGSSGGGQGGGIYISPYYLNTTTKIIRNNSISYNVVSNSDSGYPCYGGSAAYLWAADVSFVSNRMIENATIGYFNNDSVIYIANTPSDTKFLTNLIGGSNQTGIGLSTDNSLIGNIDANVFATNRMQFLYKRTSRTVTNDSSWTNINDIIYTGAGSLTTPNMVTNL